MPAVPASEIVTRFWPPGPTSSASMSPSNAWLTFLRVRVTFTTAVGAPVMKMFDGYGVDGPLSEIAIGPVLQYWLPVTVVALSTRWLTVALLVAQRPVPLYVAVMRWLPSGKVEVVKAA